MPNISLSTGWQPHDRLEATFSEILLNGVNRIELHRMSSPTDIADVIAFSRDHGVAIGSLHAVLQPWLTERANCAGDFLVSEDPVKRDLTRALIDRSAGFCQQHGIPVLVMHIGALESDEIRRQDLLSMQTGELIAPEVVQLREELGKPGVERILATLDRLAASYRDVRVAVEVRNRLSYFPTPNELTVILESTAHDRIGYWHDMAHARAYERLVGFPRPAWFQIAGSRAWGNHVQDSTLAFREHMPIGAGDDEFTLDVLGEVEDWVLEISQEHSAQAISESVTQLRAFLASSADLAAIDP